MKKSAYYSDIIFLFCFVFFCSVFLLIFCSVPLILTLFLSIPTATLSAYLLAIYYKKKQKIFALKKSEELEKNDLFFYLCLIPIKDKKQFLSPALPVFSKHLNEDELKKDGTPTPSNEPNDETPFLFYEKHAFLPVFKFRELSTDDVATLYPIFKDENFPVLLCDKIYEDAKTLCEKLSVKVIDGPLFYRLIKDAKLLPKEYPIKTINPVRRSRRKISFAKNNSRRFFISGITLLFFSLFIPFPIYYLLFGSILLLLSLAVRIFGYR